MNDKECGPWIKTVITTKEGRTRERKVHPVCKDPSLKKYLVINYCIISKYKSSVKLCLACEEKGLAKRYFKQSHKCSVGATSKDNQETQCNARIVFLELVPVIEKSEKVDSIQST